MVSGGCERQVEGPDEAPIQQCGKPTPHDVAGRYYGAATYRMCTEHAREAENDGAIVDPTTREEESDADG